MTPGSIKVDGHVRTEIPANDNQMAGADIPTESLLDIVQSDDFADVLCAKAERLAAKVVVLMAICLTSTLVAGVYFLLLPS
ncbi:hypothetical protein LB542_25055 [Mesorhizobium sp. BR1-1-9]|uniref:hypothetical protein n=1 Tax=unclassified Mesorhizobium TaxID=325217 RepID=UPI00112EF71D|nr:MULTISPECIES: hypothetical protein [unclassified Mesorhizobium]MBZ9808208.1 hypothetical protein [Mesorhizobium sp. ESP-6-2]MBZ9874108.1 hypothetical protein [Mesorhizobium sp. BR1-1-9]MBZ9941101.1 hypothetical protein [Mesorhizobium sp. BR1-1-13]TPM33660.1 hypothetical protein FJ955_02645 [Mesorhizobium sp. B2-2-2]